MNLEDIWVVNHFNKVNYSLNGKIIIIDLIVTQDIKINLQLMCLMILIV